MMEELEKRLKEALEQCKVRGKNTPAFKAVFSQGFRAAWNINPLWKDAQGDDLPEYDREVVVFQRFANDGLQVCMGHRPNPDGYVVVGGEKLFAKLYEGGWNLPDIVWWLDLDLPKLEEQQ